MENLSLHKLLVEAKHGNDQSFAQIITLMQQHIFRYCLLMIGNKHDAEDIVQEIFVRAYLKLHTYDEKGKGNASGWLFTIAHRICLNDLKKRSRWRRLLAKAANEEVVRYGDLEFMNDNDLSLLESLTPKQRELVVLKVLHEMSYEEISEIVGVSVINLRKRFERVRKKLQMEHADNFKGRVNYEH